ncbi:cysteine proteinase [Lophiostoma macrostomum CBS 122681]|uniref:ubiquitinyl hydrolase 1 n=1 Tax=Lophiostoma macrostomum CBS 122681 TaxID=1314788 RepID=A0A6A6TLB6_9PLEO|nr:cysteine proteinase [Lophiostoma macrostomum CBS 122681]
MAKTRRPRPPHQRDSARIQARKTGRPSDIALPKTDLQCEKDRSIARISKKWWRTPRKRDWASRGLYNHGRHADHMNSVFQSLLHQPAFVNWIRRHRECDVKTGLCGICSMRLLIEEYWDQKPLYYEAGAGTASMYNPSTASYYLNDPLADGPTTPLGELARNAHRHGAGKFPLGLHEDAEAFYRWFLPDLKECIKRMPVTDREASTFCKQYDALYKLDCAINTTCDNCHRVIGHLAVDWTSFPHGLSIWYDNTMTTLEEAIDSTLNDIFATEERRGVCAVPPKGCYKRGDLQRPQTARFEIEGAPHILLLYLRLFNTPARDTEPHRLQIPATLDLTQRQRIKDTPLRYRLSSMICHRGRSYARHFTSVVRGKEKDARIDDDKVLYMPRTDGPFPHNPGNHPYILTYIRDERDYKGERELLGLALGQQHFRDGF